MTRMRPSSARTRYSLSSLGSDVRITSARRSLAAENSSGASHSARLRPITSAGFSNPSILAPGRLM